MMTNRQRYGHKWTQSESNTYTRSQSDIQMVTNTNRQVHGHKETDTLSQIHTHANKWTYTG